MKTIQNYMQNPQLDGEEFFLPGNDIGFLLMHGFTATTTEVKPLAQLLHNKGFTISAPLLPGHGTTPEDLNAKKWMDWTAYIEEKFRQLATICRVVFVGGESMGGLLSLNLAWKHPEIRGVLLYAPALKIHSLKSALILSLIKSFHWKEGGDDGMAWKGYRIVPLRASRQLFLLQRRVNRSLPDIHNPVLICQGKLDRTLDASGAQVLFEKLGSSDKTISWFEYSQHCILLDQEFNQVADASLAFINRILANEGLEEG